MMYYSLFLLSFLPYASSRLSRTTRVVKFESSCVVVVGDTMNTKNVVSSSSLPVEDTPRNPYISTKNEIFLFCETPEGLNYEIPAISQEWIESQIRHGKIHSGYTKLILPEDTLLDTFTHKLIVNGDVILDNDDGIPPLHRMFRSSYNMLGVRGNRNLLTRKLNTLVADKANGSKSILVVKVIMNDGEPTTTEDVLRKSVFANGPGEVSLSSQYSACSHGKLNFVKAKDASGIDTRIVEGVVSVKIDLSIVSPHGMIRNYVTEELNRQFGTSSPNQLADHVMYCLPPGSMPHVAYGMVGSHLSVYLNNWATYISALMHEIGHNIGWGHSNTPTQKYADRSDMLGYSYAKVGSPRMCVNPSRQWTARWFDHRSLVLNDMQKAKGDRQLFYEGDISSTTVDPNVGSIPMLIKIDSETTTTYYIGFNALDSANIGTVQAGNKLTLHSIENINEKGADSVILAALGTGESYAIVDYDGTGLNMLLTVINIDASSMRASIILNCDADITSSPSVSTAPTVAPRIHTTIVEVIVDGTCDSSEGQFLVTEALNDSILPVNTDAVVETSDPICTNLRHLQTSSTYPNEIAIDTGVNKSGVVDSFTSEQHSIHAYAIPGINSVALQATITQKKAYTDQTDFCRDEDLVLDIYNNKATVDLEMQRLSRKHVILREIRVLQMPSAQPTSLPSTSPSFHPSIHVPIVGECYDAPENWYDTDGPAYNCYWYSQGNRCGDFGNLYANFGKTANQACCGCGGGETVTNSPTQSPSMATSSHPTETASSTRSFNIVTFNSPPNLNHQYSTNGPTMQHSMNPTFSVSDLPSMRPTFVPSSKPTMVMSETPSSSPSLLASRSPSTKPSVTKSASPTFQPSHSPTMTDSSAPTSQPSPSPSVLASMSPSTFPSTKPSAKPSAFPILSPSSQPTMLPSRTPSASPSITSSSKPSYAASASPSVVPSSIPSAQATLFPSKTPTLMPSGFPVSTPSAHPTRVASTSPSLSHQPSVNPTVKPSFVGSNHPSISSSPSKIPTSFPTLSPTSSPTKSPTPNPTVAPTSAPSRSPTSSPTAAPTSMPTPFVPVIHDAVSQCCFDLQTLTCRVDWCGESESNCGGCGITVKWMEPESSCMPLYADCSTDTDGCCGSTSCVQQGMECPGDGSYCQCLLSTEETTEAPATTPVETSSPTQTLSAWRLHTTSEETVSNCLWDVKRIRFYGSSDCSTDEFSTVGGTSFSSGHKSYSSSTNAFKSSDIWAGTCKNGEYWIGIFFPHEVDIHCVSIQNDHYNEVNSLSVQKKNLVTGAWEEVAFENNMDTSDQAVNIIPIQDTMPPVMEPTSNDDIDFQCCFDLQTLTCRVDWCGESESNCGGCGITVKWMEPESSCMPLYADCSTDTDGCCGSTSCVQQGMECPGDGSYCQCLLNTENPISISYVNFDGAVANTESDEYVEISSNSNYPIDISGYYVYVATSGNQGPTFYFPEGTILASHSKVRVYTDEVHQDSGGFSFGSGKAIWNNAAGHAILKNSSDEIVAEYEYESTTSPTVAPTKSPTRPQIDTDGISISNIFYDGLVPRSESDEYIEISNDSDSAIDITGFYVYVDKSGEQGATFVFPEGTVLDVGSSVRVYTDEIHEESGGFSFGSGKAIWSNGGGVGIFKDNNDELVSEYSYP